MTAQLPLHPTMRHPHTGARIRAIAERPLGGYLYPMMGASPDDPAEPTAEQKAAAEKEAADTKAAAEKKAADDKAAAEKKSAEQAGYPANTKVEDMTLEQQVAYYRHQQQKHEGRNKELMRITGGKYGDDLAKQLEEGEKARRAQLSAEERRVEDAREEGRSTAISTASRQLAAQFFDVSLDHVEEDQRKVLLETIDLASVVNSDGTIDTDKVKRVAGILAPKDAKSTNRDRDYGGGRRGGSSSQQSTGTAAGRSRYQQEQDRRKQARGTKIESGS